MEIIKAILIVLTLVFVSYIYINAKDQEYCEKKYYNSFYEDMSPECRDLFKARYN